MKTRWAKISLGVVVLSMAGLFLARAIEKSESPPSGPVTVVVGKSACDHCGMHISDISFAAQLHDENGKTWLFDDVGCMVRHIGVKKPRVHAMYVHSMKGDTWIPMTQASFVKVPHSPMGYNYGALGNGEGISFAQLTLELAK